MKKFEYTHPTGVKTLIICLLARPDALPLSYRGHVEAKVTKLGPCGKHPAYF